MSEFKGTKGKLTVREAVGARGEVLYFNVQHKGNSIANFSPNPYTEIPTSLDSAKANAVLFSKAPEMLAMLESMKKELYWCINKLQEYGEEVDFQTVAEVNQLIKEATE
ncbi:hypothetical protein HZP39_04215 [Elizabethkingia anophelis]|nr:hypothetical protein [Elizabethkingia anophelis]MCT4239429.1 hypothetical protein [Elizabethkingia anophelis]MCT4282000.1 hypothetical protein [Elizabethkingia anophelis]MCT4292585.1 hypothetical protein [Elizabethkingia anophelis]